MHDDLSALHDSVREIARIGGATTLRFFRGRDLEVERKADESPVTAADRETEAAIRSAIAERFPDQAIVGEELGGRTPPAGFSWLIDPIDGTKSFIRGTPLYTTLVALLRDGVPVAGAIYAPVTGEMVSAYRDGGAWDESGQRVTVKEETALDRSWIMVTDPVDLARRAPNLSEGIVTGAGAVRTWADGYGYLLVARGDADAMVDPIMNPWDVGPLGIIIREAGGIYTSITGGTEPLPTSCVAACGPAVHATLLDLARSDV